MPYKLLFLLLFMATQTACVGWSAERCADTDWERLGENDGDRGYPADRIALYTEQCARHGIAPDRAAYALGHLGGRDDYCTVAGGIDAGRAGRTYSGICEAGFEDDFLDGHQLGRRLYAADRDLRQFELELNQYELELAYNRALPDDRRRYYLQRAFRLRNLIGAAEDEVRRLERIAAERLTR